MQLKKLQLLGFKTFADKTEILIDSGLTAIVGPNGSGKSNIVDALLWVLGEQNPRLLRGAAAQDVIFAGTDSRKPLGMAEVRLTVDNSDGSLPLKFAEITITRRIYRSGESQYLLNGAPCRLKDIVELFLDTGMGKGAYSFVSQNEIDAVLSARPEDRRELFEEAAGIKKYRVKKREALRKLESADGNLDRVRDILSELEAQREPMERTAIIARRYVLLEERLHEIEVGLLVSEMKTADYELGTGRREQAEDEAALLALEIDSARLEHDAGQLRATRADTEAQLEAARHLHQEASSLFERSRGRAALLGERSSNADRTREQLTQERTDLDERISVLSTNIAADKQEREEGERLEAVRRNVWAAERASLTELDKAVANALRETQEKQGRRMRLAQERAGREAALKASRDRCAESKARAARIEAEIEALTQSLAEAGVRAEEAELHRAAKVKVLEGLAAERAEGDARRQAVQTEQVSLRTELDGARRLHAEQSSRLSTLAELQASHEGFYQGVRAVLNACNSGQLQGHYRAVVDLLTVPELYRTAIEVALGGSLQDIVTETEAEAKAGIRRLKETRAGRATFLALPLLRPAPRLEAVRGGEEICGVALDLVEIDARYARAAQLLLGRVLVVTDMDAAIAASRRLTGWSKIVTLEGELLSPGGALTGGSLQGRGAHLVGRKGEMDDLTAALPALKAKVERLTAQFDYNAAQLHAMEAARNELLGRESTVLAEQAAAGSAAAGIEREARRLTQEQAARRAAYESLTGQVAALEREIAGLEEALAKGAAENLVTDDALTALSEETRNLASRRDEKRAAATAIEVEVSRLREKREGLARSIASDGVSLAQLQHQREINLGRRDRMQTEQSESAAEQMQLTQRLEEIRLDLEKAQTSEAAWQEKRRSVVAQSDRLEAELTAVRNRRAELTKLLHAVELRIARLDLQCAQAAERLQEEYSIERADALSRPDDTAPDRATAVEVGRLRRELRGMGQVNTGAAEEYDRLTERHAFLAAQAADLQKSREGLLATIAEIDESTRGVFMETFNAVANEFNGLFQRLFNGGSTRLTLSNPHDLLETGVEIIAQPPGKKAQQLSLLSGGERALTATALLFAFLAVKPSPFVLLDEVDAPLDGANVEKFTRLVKEFSQKSQFLIITHNPTTMEAAPTWYGVTMKTPGVSGILSYRVPQEALVTEPDEAVILAAE